MVMKWVAQLRYPSCRGAGAPSLPFSQELGVGEGVTPATTLEKVARQAAKRRASRKCQRELGVTSIAERISPGAAHR